MKTLELVLSVVIGLVFSFCASWVAFTGWFLIFMMLSILGQYHGQHPADIDPTVYAAVGQIVLGIGLVWRQFGIAEENEILSCKLSEARNKNSEAHKKRMCLEEWHVESDAELLHLKVHFAAELLRSKGKSDDRKRVAKTRDCAVVDMLNQLGRVAPVARGVNLDQGYNHDFWNKKEIEEMFLGRTGSLNPVDAQEIQTLLRDAMEHQSEEFARAISNLPPDIAQIVTQWVIKPQTEPVSPEKFVDQM